MPVLTTSQRQRLIVLLIVAVLYAAVVSYADLHRADEKVIDVDSLDLIHATK